MPRRLAALLSFALLSLALAGCGTLRDWISSFRGLNSDTGYYEPGAGQYRQPALEDYAPE